MKLLILGGSGFVSGTLARTALGAGHNVWVITRGKRPVPPGATALVADRRDGTAFEAAVRGAGTNWDLVIDSIGFEPGDAAQDLTLFRDRAAHLVFISTDFVFDPAHRRYPQAEQSDHYLADGYGGKKRQCELIFLESDPGRMAWTILRPCHIYGPGSLLGCLPMHGRDAKLIERLRAGETLKLAGGGHFLQQPVFAPDLARTILSCHGNPRATGQIYQVAGPDILTSRRYYQTVADALGVALKIEEVPVEPLWNHQPDLRPFLCHRIYDLGRLRQHNLVAPATPVEEGLRVHVKSLG